jgi:hypothetical protein
MSFVIAVTTSFTPGSESGPGASASVSMSLPQLVAVELPADGDQHDRDHLRHRVVIQLTHRFLLLDSGDVRNVREEPSIELLG